MRIVTVVALAVGTMSLHAGSPLDEGRALYAQRKLAEAKNWFECSGSVDSCETKFYLGKIAVLQGRHADAVRQLERAVEISPERADYWVWLGNSLAWSAAEAPVARKAEFGRRCLQAYRTAVERDPRNVRAHVALMNYYRHVPAFFGGGAAAARREAEEVHRLDRHRGELAEAVLLIDAGDYPPAFAGLDGLLRREPQDYAANALFGQLTLLAQARLDEGQQALRKCAAQVPDEDDEAPEVIAARLEQLVRLRRGATSITSTR